MVEIGTEYPGIASPSPDFSKMEQDPGHLTFEEHPGRLASLVFSDMTDRIRDLTNSAIPLAPLRTVPPGIPFFFPPVAETAPPDYLRPHMADRVKMVFLGRKTHKGSTYLLDGMFNSRDKLARIGVVVTVSGIPLGNTDVILNGLEHREIVKTDERGIWWKYLEIDDYPDALFISPNGIVYALLNQKEREDNEGIFDQMVTRRTIANATNRQIHRRFV